MNGKATFKRPVLGLLAAALAGAGLLTACGSKPLKPAASLAASAAMASTSTTAWRELGEAPKARTRAATALLGPYWHVVGGRTLKGDTWEHQNFRAFDAWFLSDLAPQPVSGAGLAAVGETQLLLVGGEVEKRPTGATWLWDENTGAWEEHPAMPTPRMDASLVTRGGQVFVLGGLASDGYPTTAFECYSPFTRRWTALAPLPLPTTGGVAAILGDRLVYAGGRNLQGISGLTWLYDFRTRQWSQDPARMPTPRVGAAVACDGRFMVVMGGRTTKAIDPNEVSDQVERYDRSQGWRPMPKLPQPVEGAAATLMQEHLVVSGGLIGGLPAQQLWGLRFMPLLKP